MTAPLATCWSDESRGLKKCRRDDLRAVAWRGGAALGCGKCKIVLGEPLASDAACEHPDGWR